MGLYEMNANDIVTNRAPTLKYVDHTYRDFSRYVEDGGELIRHKKSGNNFPARLHRMLTDASVESDVMTWMPHGRAWKILDKRRMIDELLPNYYTCKKYESFSRQLNGWGFKRLHQSGPDFGCYYHESFLRDMPELTCLIRRLPPNLGKSTPYAEGEPNFYLISEEYPLPPPPREKEDTPKPSDAPNSLLGGQVQEEGRARAASIDSASVEAMTRPPPPPTVARGVSDGAALRPAAAVGPKVIPPEMARASTAPEASAPYDYRSGWGGYGYPSDVNGNRYHPQRQPAYSVHAAPSSNSYYGHNQYYGPRQYNDRCHFPPLLDGVPEENCYPSTQYGSYQGSAYQEYQSPAGPTPVPPPPQIPPAVDCLAYPDCDDCPATPSTNAPRDDHDGVDVVSDPYEPIPVSSPSRARTMSVGTQTVEQGTQTDSG